MRSWITAPVTYGSYSQTLTTLTLGVAADHRLSDKVRVLGGVYATRDLARTSDAVSGSAAAGGITDFTFAAPDVLNETRLGADLSMFFDVGNDSRIYTRTGVQRASNTGKPTFSLALGYETRF